MRSLRITTVLMLLASPAYAQQQSDDTLLLAGVKLKLGTPKDAAIQSIKGQYSLRPDEQDSYFVMERSIATGLYSIAGTIKFTNNRLSFASKYWASDCKDVIEALHTILSQARQNGRETAWFMTGAIREPNTSYHEITMAVGKRRITISSATLKDHGQTVSVEEAIGAKNIP